MKTAKSLHFQRITTITLIWETYLALKLQLVRGRSYETYNAKGVKKGNTRKRQKQKRKRRGRKTLQFFSLNNILHSFFSNVEVYINNQEIYNCNGLYAHKSHISNNFKGAISEYKGVLHCEG